MEFCTTLHFWETTMATRMKIDPYYQQQKCSSTTPSFRKYKVYADIRGGSLGGVVIFGDFTGYFFGNVRDKASNITWQYATPC